MLRCVCKYAPYCMPPRQDLQSQFRKNGVYDKVEECEFYRMIDEKTKQEENGADAE